ncbi:fungal-specific transcription factor domain-containing protein [Lipomyces kononenkoae]|uniref:Fungal-specific transcription factor domain-containing protein n=1 Tax=Lipomyces kononenkoae TaxID=34357 RepID=A0ACC3STT5_LIPKO
MSHPPSALARSCLECRRRKIKCDRSLPCSYCVKVKVQCSYPPPSATPQNAGRKTADGDVVARIERTERTLESFEQGLSRIWQLLQAKSSSSLSDRTSAHDLVHQPHEIGYGDIETRQCPARPYKDDELCPLFKAPLTSALESLHPPTELISFIWQKYLESVEPVLKVFHAPTVQKQIVDFIRGRGALETATECVMFAIYYAAVITMTKEECQAEFNEGKHEVLKRYRNGVESSLSKANLMESLDMTVLQALVIYLICGRRDDQGPDVHMLIGTAIGIAFKIGLHRDGAALGLPPFQVEMRRRLWWQIYILDIRTAEDRGADPRILESWFNTRLPSNVNDASLDSEMREPPPNTPGRTEMLFSLVRFEISNFARRVVFSDRFCSDNCYPSLSVAQKCKAIDRFRERVEKDYLSHCDKNIPLDFITAASSRLILVKLKLTVSKPRARQDQTLLMQVNFRKVCVEILQRDRTLRSYEKGRQWLWLFQIYIEWDLLACLFINLSLAPKGDGLDLAWETVDEIYEYWKSNGDTHRDHRWENIEELRSMALLAREMIRSDPTRWRLTSNDNTIVDEPEAMTAVSSQGIHPKTSKRRREDDLDPLLDREARSPKCLSEVPIMQLEELPRMWALANAAAAAPAAVDHSSHTEPTTETTDTPSSGTACQWSPALFERYFQVLGSEHASRSRL